jgi:parallel beta-helix repeat protein
MNFIDRQQLISIYIVFALITLGFVGILVFEGVVDQNGVEGATLIVGPGQIYTKVQDAINNASNGDTIKVWEGNYSEKLLVNKKISLIGNGSSNTTIIGNGQGDTIRITSNNVNISGFKVTGSGSVLSDSGIDLDSVRNCRVENNSCTNNRYGIRIKNSYNLVKNNNCSNNTVMGINVYNANRNHILNNTILNNIQGIWLETSDYNSIKNNNCSNNKYNGLVILYSSDFNAIDNNTINNTTNGINIGYSSGNFISNISMQNCGILISGDEYNDYIQYIDETNLVNGKTLYYYYKKNGISVPSNAGQIILVDCTNFNINNFQFNDINTPILIAYSSYISVDNNSFANNNFICIDIQFSSNSTIADNNLKYNSGGIYLYYSDNNEILRNNCSEDNGNYDVIYLLYSNFNKIIDNKCYNNIEDGIGCYGSEYCTIKNNICINNELGIDFSGSSNCTVADNICNNNRESYGIKGDRINNCKIDNNVCSANNHSGILFKSGYRNIIKNNICKNNKQEGILLWETNDNSFSANKISNNLLGIKNYASDNNIFDRDNISMNNDLGVWITKSRDILFDNCSVLSNRNYDFQVTVFSGNNIALNSTFDSVKCDQSGDLIKKNYLNIQVNDTSGLPVKNADVEIIEDDRVIYASNGYGGSNEKTDKNGQIKWIPVADGNFYSDNKFRKNDVFINVKYQGLNGRNKFKNIDMSLKKYY